jgi:calcium/calmodulin-dependent protein kinase I
MSHGADYAVTNSLTTTTALPMASTQTAVPPTEVQVFSFDSDYTLVDRLRSGAYGTVYTTRHNQTHEEFAVKVIDRSKLKKKKDDDAVFKEVQIMKELIDVPNVVTLIDFYVTPKTFHVVQAYAKGGDVFDRLASKKNYTEKDARSLAIILLQVLRDLHAKRICHRDLKPENLLLQETDHDATILVADFGFATKITPEQPYLQTRCGTPAFVAPEIVIGRPYREGVDCWSAGCIIYMLLCGRPPFHDDSLRGLYRKIRAADYAFYDDQGWKYVSVHAKRLISQFLTVDPNFRSSAARALQSSSWLQVDEANLSNRDLSIGMGEINNLFQTPPTKTTGSNVGTSTHPPKPGRLQSAVKAAFCGVFTTAAFRFDQVSELEWNAKEFDVRQLEQQEQLEQKQQQQQQPGAPSSASSPSTAPTKTPTSSTARTSGVASASSSTTTPTPTKKVGTGTPPRRSNNQQAAQAHQGRKKFSLYRINPRQFSQVYELGDKIQTGSFAVVHACRHIETGKDYAVKKIPRQSPTQPIPPGSAEPSTDASVLHEVGIMNQLDHPHIVRVVDFFEHETYYYIVMERMRGGDVFDRILAQKQYTEKDARDLSRILLKALAYMHERGIAHRDLKPQNLLLATPECNATIKIADFGFARRVHTPKSLTSRCGTPSYVAPEILKQIPHDTSCDMWSVGVILYVLLCGSTPFMDDNQERMFDRIKRGHVQFTPAKHWETNVSEDAKDLIRKLLVVEPDKRLTAAQALQSKWMMQDDVFLRSRDLSTSALVTLKEKRPRLQDLARAFMGIGRIAQSNSSHRESSSSVHSISSNSPPESPVRLGSLGKDGHNKKMTSTPEKDKGGTPSKKDKTAATVTDKAMSLKKDKGTPSRRGSKKTAISPATADTDDGPIHELV